MNAKRIALPVFAFLLAAIAALSAMAAPQTAYAEGTGSLAIHNTGSVARDYSYSLNNGEATTVTVGAGQTYTISNLTQGTKYSVTQLAYDDVNYVYIEAETKTGTIGEMTYYYSDNSGLEVEINQSEYGAATGATSGPYSYNGVVTDNNEFVAGSTSANLSVTSSTSGWGPFTVTTYTATYYIDGNKVASGSSVVQSRAIANAQSNLASAYSGKTITYDSSNNATIYNDEGTVTTRTYYTSEPELNVALSFSTTLEKAPTATVSVNFAKLNTIPYADETATFQIFNADGTATSYTATINTTSLASIGYTTYSFTLPRGLAGGTQYYLQQTEAPTGYDADSTQYWFTVNVNGSVTAGTNTQMDGTTIYNNDYSINLVITTVHYYLFTNSPKVLLDGSIVLTQTEFSTTYNADAATENDAILNQVVAAIDEESSNLPENRNYKLEYLQYDILGYEFWTDVPTDASLDAGTYTMRLVVEDASENPDYNDTTSSEFTVTIERAPVEVTVNSQSITYGETPTDLVVTTPSDAEALKVYVGIGANDSALATGYVYLDIPSNDALDMSSTTGIALTALRELLGSTNVSLSDLEDVLKLLFDEDTVDQIFSYLPDSVQNITVSSGQPTEAGAYLVTGIAVDRNYEEGQYALGYLTIAPDTTDTELQWNIDIDSFVTLDELAAGVDFNATLYKSGTAVEGASIQYRWIYMNEDGVSVEVDAPSADKPGVYSQIAYLYGSTQAAPITRTFAVYGEASVTVNSATIGVNESIPTDLVVSTPEGIDTLTVYAGITGDGNGFIGVTSSNPESTQAQTIVNALSGLNAVDLKQSLINLGMPESTVEMLFYYLPEDTGTITVVNAAPDTSQSGNYAVAALAIEFGYVPAADLGTLTVTKNTTSAELQWNSDASGTIPVYTIDEVDFTASAYVDGEEETSLEGNVKYLYVGTTDSGSAYVSNQAPTETGQYLQIAMLIDGTYYAENIQRAFTITNVHSVEVFGGTAYDADGTEITEAEAGSTVTITWTSGNLRVFQGWLVTGGDVTLDDETASTTTFTMPSQNVTVVAQYHEHTLTEHAGTDATCTESGMETYYECAGCGKLYYGSAANEEVADRSDLTIPALGHNMTKHEYQAATTTEMGTYAYYVCNRCGLWFWDEAGTEEIANHDDVIIPIDSSEVKVVGGSAYDANGNKITEATYGDTVTIKAEPTSLQVFERLDSGIWQRDAGEQLRGGNDLHHGRFHRTGGGELPYAHVDVLPRSSGNLH